MPRFLRLSGPRAGGRLLAAGAGALLPLAFAPFGWFWLAPLLLLALFGSWYGQAPREAAWRGFCFGFAAFLCGTWWVYISVRVFGEAPAWLAVFLLLALVAIMGLFLALTGWLAARAADGHAGLAWGLAFPGAFTLVEWVRGWVFTGFPWLSVGYAHTDGPLAAWAPVVGVYGVTLVAALAAGWTLGLLVGRGRPRLVAALGLLALVAATALVQDRQWTRADGRVLRVALVQGAVTQDRKWLPSQRRPTMELYEELSFMQRDVDLVVWPEVAIPALAHQVRSYLDAVDRRAADLGIPLLLGILVYDFDREQYYNSLVALGTAEAVYHKRHLVPFGEYFPVPAFIREWMRLMSLPYRDAAAGADDQPPLSVNGMRFAPSICYEDAFGAEQRDFLPAAGLLVNVSNDAWFGDSIAPHQHLQIARMRALESGRWMLRATNTGVTALIGPDGTVRARLPQFEVDVLRGVVELHGGATPWVRSGNTPAVTLAFLLSAAGFGRRRTSR